MDADDGALVESYFETIKKIQRLDTPTQFCVAFPELGRVINHIDGTADQAARAIYDLYRRHAKQVGDALGAQGRAAISQLRLEELPSNCGLSITFAGQRGEPADATPSISGEGGDGTTSNGLVFDESRFSIAWDGQPPLEIGNRKEFHLLQELVKSEGRYVAFTDLAERLGGDVMDKVTHIRDALRRPTSSTDSSKQPRQEKRSKAFQGRIGR